MCGILLLELGLPLPASAQELPLQKVVESVEIDAAPEKVWSVVGTFHDMSWLPGVVKTSGTGGNTPKEAKRTLAFGSGATIEEELTHYNAAGLTYSYRIVQVDPKVLPVTHYTSTLTVLAPEAGGKTKLEWEGAFARASTEKEPPPEFNDAAAVKAVTAVYRAGLENVKKKSEISK
nr:SRPBCC family protein [Beijerinckia indica]